MFSPDFIKAIDPTGAALDLGQLAALAGFATLLGGGLGSLAGANADGAATAAQNEAVNNSGDPNHVATSAQNGGAGSAFANWLQFTYGDPIGSIENWGGQLLGLMQANNGQTPPSDPNNQLSGGSNGNPPNTGAAPVTPPILTCVPVPGAECVVTPPLISPGSPNNAPSNAIQSSCDGGNSGESSPTSQAPSTGGTPGATNSSTVPIGETAINLSGNSGVFEFAGT
jgi:filamentous hemagglutinin